MQSAERPVLTYFGRLPERSVHGRNKASGVIGISAVRKSEMIQSGKAVLAHHRMGAAIARAERRAEIGFILMARRPVQGTFCFLQRIVVQHVRAGHDDQTHNVKNQDQCKKLHSFPFGLQK